MRVTRAEAAENREKIVDAASRLFREGGVATTGVDAIMREAGLTHGGFYGHFASKDQLAAEACSRALARSLERWTSLAQNDDPIAAIATHYLSTRHRDNPGEGCLMAALASEAGRSSRAVRRAFTHGVQSLLKVLEDHATSDNPASTRQDALAMLSAWVGALVMARAVDDQSMSDEFLKAVSHPNKRTSKPTTSRTSPKKS